jgi:hypothetical protein
MNINKQKKELQYSLIPIIEQMIKKYGWDNEYALDVMIEYRRFLVLRRENIYVSPSDDVDLFWHQHILNTGHYNGYCKERFGIMIHHSPTDADDQKERNKRLVNTYIAYLTKYNEKPNPKIWPIRPTTKSENDHIIMVLKYGYMKKGRHGVYDGYYYEKDSDKPYDGKAFRFKKSSDRESVLERIRKITGYGTEYVLEFRDISTGCLYTMEELVNYPDKVVLHCELKMNRSLGC